jgi:ATP-dependent DNA ligase
MLRARSFALDGEAAVFGVDGLAGFDALHRRHEATDAIRYAFDLLEFNGKDLRPMPRYRRGRRPGLFNKHTDQEGAVVFRYACKLGLRASCRSGPSRDWVKVKNAPWLGLCWNRVESSATFTRGRQSRSGSKAREFTKSAT